MNEIYPTIYEQVPQPYKEEEFCPFSPSEIITLSQEEEFKMHITDKWYINYN